MESAGLIAAILSLAIGVILMGLIAFIFFYIPLRLWYIARSAGVKVDYMQLIFMRIRKVPQEEIVNAMIIAHKAGLSLSPVNLEAHYLAGGNVFGVVKALIYAKNANIEFSFMEAAALDLSGNNAFIETVLLAKKNDIWQ